MSRDEINIRIQIADERIAVLGEDFHGFCETLRDIVEFTKEDRGASDSMSLITIPVRWRVRIGEIAYLLRSSLDHLVWQLVLENGNTPNQRNMFPIYSHLSGKQRDFNQMLKGVDPEHKRKIVAFNKDWRANLFPLWDLNALCNIDKHRYSHMAHADLAGLTDDYWRREELCSVRCEPLPEVTKSDLVLTVFFFDRGTASTKEWRPKGEVVARLKECSAAVKEVVNHILHDAPIGWPFVHNRR